MRVGTAWTPWVHVLGLECKGHRAGKGHTAAEQEKGVSSSCTLSLTDHTSNNYYAHGCILFLYHINGYNIVIVLNRITEMRDGNAIWYDGMLLFYH